nr:sigma-70 family RNA polymerase sigma factor [uncultured Lachnoclostridium sp.]
MKKSIDNEKMYEIVEKYSDEILRMSYIYLNNLDAAYEVVQNVFLKVYLNYWQFNGRSTEHTWIFRIVINECKNYLKSAWKTRIVLSNDFSKETFEPQYESNRNEELISIIQSLPAKYKEVILLYYYEELKIREISKILHISQSTVGSRLIKARELLKKEMKERNVYEKFQRLL